jgi:hypothetical protein
MFKVVIFLHRCLTLTKAPWNENDRMIIIRGFVETTQDQDNGGDRNSKVQRIMQIWKEWKTFQKIISDQLEFVH